MAPTHVLVTGCSTGIGRALAEEFHERGCKVLATARRLEAISDLAAMGIATAVVDVADPATLKSAICEFGAVDIVVANAGVSGMVPLIEQELSQIENIFQTNVVGVIATAQAAVPAMIEGGGGLVVVIGSVSSAMITPYAGAYCASKAAVGALCKALRMELAPFKVGVLHVVTGSIRSHFGASAKAASNLRANSRSTPPRPSCPSL